MRAACLITGELRGSDAHHTELIGRLMGAELFVATYPSFCTQAARFTSHYLLVDTVPHLIPRSGANQWLLLQECCRHFAAELRRFDVIVRVRTDLRITEPIIDKVAATATGLHLLSDNFFFAPATQFLAVCSDVYDAFCRRGYYRAHAERRLLLPNWHHLARSRFVHGRNTYPTRWYYLMYPKRYFASTQRHDCAAMMAVLRGALDEIVAVPSRYEDFQDLARLDLRPAGSFDSETAFLHHCLLYSPVLPTGLEDTVLLYG